jgi:hypothetical protein
VSVPANAETPTVIDAAALARRVARFEKLFLGLSNERVAIRKGADPLLYVERIGYIEALQAAIEGLECARVLLARVRQRLEGGAADEGPSVLLQ